MSNKRDGQRDKPTPSLPLLTNAGWLQSAETQTILTLLEDAGYPARIVGGAVRNAVLDTDVVDIDIATVAKPDTVMELAKAGRLGAYPTGIDHGTVTLVANHRPYEVTTLRKDVSTDGRRATVAFTTDWTEDAKRRDFTINALYCDRHGQIYDPLGNAQDLIKRNVRFIGNAKQRIAEDYLRILRFFRFSATYADGPFDDEGLAACVDGREQLRRLSAERIQTELLRILVTSRACDAVSAMQAHSIFEPTIGRSVSVPTFIRAATIENNLNLEPDSIRRLAALATKTEDDSQTLAKSLRLANTMLSRLARANQHANLFEADLDEKTGQVLLYKLGGQTFTDSAILAWSRSTQSLEQPTMTKTLNLPKRWHPPEFPFSGTDVLNLGIAAGPQVGNILHTFEEWWIKAQFPDDHATLNRKLREFAALTKR